MSLQKFEKQDIVSYENKEAKEYFLSKEEAVEKE